MPDTDKLECLSVEDVIETLRSLRIPESVQERFRDQQVDGCLLKGMREMDFQEDFEMKPFHAMKLRKFIDGWRPNLH